MGANLKNFMLGEVQPQCSDCGVALCWSISDLDYMMWKGFWDDWTCSDCNPNYKGAYERYKNENEPFKEVLEKLKTENNIVK